MGVPSASGLAASGLAVGVDIGGTKLRALRLGPDGQVEDEEFQASPQSGEDLISEVVESATRLCGGPPPALGVGVPGMVNRSGSVLTAPNLLGVKGTSVVTSLRRALPDAAMWVGNDATAACWAEHAAGAGAGCDEMLLVTLGTGIGGGIVSGGRLHEGANGFAGEFGHMVVDPNGPRCPCGKRGCWERYASGAGLGFLGRELAMAGAAARLVELAGGDPEAVRGEHVTSAAAEGDGPAMDIMGRFGWWVALGLANLANAFDPAAIVLGGGLADAGEVLMDPVVRAFDDLVQGPIASHGVRIVPAAFGPLAGAVGAGLMARRTAGTAS